MRARYRGDGVPAGGSFRPRTNRKEPQRNEEHEGKKESVETASSCIFVRALRGSICSAADAKHAERGNDHQQDAGRLRHNRRGKRRAAACSGRLAKLRAPEIVIGLVDDTGIVAFVLKRPAITPQDIVGCVDGVVIVVIAEQTRRDHGAESLEDHIDAARVADRSDRAEVRVSPGDIARVADRPVVG